MPGRHDQERPVERALEFIVESEAKRALSAAQIEADPARLADGWTRRFIIEGARVPEMIRLYEEVGYEVCADPIRGESVSDECEDCRLALTLDFRMIYTRRR